MNEQLEEFEEQLDAMSKQKLYFIYVSLAGLLIYMGWNLFGDSFTSSIEAKETKISSLEKKLQHNNIRSIEKAIKRTKKEKLILTSTLDDLKSQEMFIATKLESVNFIFFNQKSTAKILDDILKKSLTYNIDIQEISHQDMNKLYKASIYEKENISVTGSGSFKHIINFMQYIDSIKSLLKINTFKIYMDINSSINFDLNISHYGAEL